VVSTKLLDTPADWQQLARHQFSKEMGDMTEGEFASLFDDMKEYGYQGRPILLTRSKTLEVADGWHQLRAAVLTNNVPTFELYTGPDLFAEVWRRHGPRKHWNESQRAMVAARVARQTRGGDRKSDQCANLRIDPTQENAAKTMQVSRRSVQEARKVLGAGTPMLQQAVQDGAVSVSDAAAVVDEPNPVQNAAVKSVREGRQNTVRAAVKAPKGTKGKQGDPHDFFGKLIRYADSLTGGKPEFESRRKAFQGHLEAAKKELIALERACKV
jgi:hypothetical protein